MEILTRFIDIFIKDPKAHVHKRDVMFDKQYNSTKYYRVFVRLQKNQFIKLKIDGIDKYWVMGKRLKDLKKRSD